MGALPLGAWLLSRAGTLAGNTAAVAGPGREEVLAGSLARAAATLGPYAWHPQPHFIPSLHRSGYAEPQLFLEAAPTMTPRGGEGTPQAQTITPTLTLPYDCTPFLSPTRMHAPYMGETIPTLKF